ncbi:MAG: YsnF/AvaK domain-containing protein [Acidobacteriota bacterium]|nr:YsnF/AvaK domain-containing protein [Acidobacteriota bacterium]
MNKTIVGIFDDYTKAQASVKALSGAGVKQGNVSIARNEGTGKGYTTYGGANSKNHDNGESIGDEIMSFFGSLLGADEDPLLTGESGIYAESVRRGSTVVTAQVAENMVEKAAGILNEKGAIDIDRRAAQYRQAGYKKFDAKAKPYTAEQTKTEMKNFNAQSEIALPVIEEQMVVGKRVVNRGGVRVHTQVTKTPVEKQINLREENVTVDRHKVDRAVTDADMKNFKEGEFDVTTKAEEAVVGKTAKVVEEVVVGKNVTDKTKTVSGSVKRTDVEVDQLKSKKARN